MNELDVYNACMSFCKLYGNVIVHRIELTNEKLCGKGMNTEISEHNLKIEEKWLNDEFDHLYNVITGFKEGK